MTTARELLQSIAAQAMELAENDVFLANLTGDKYVQINDIDNEISSLGEE
jgi:hypothetical protein